MATRPEVVRRMKKTKSDSCSGGLGHSKKHIFILFCLISTEIKNGGENNMAARPEVVCRMKKIKPESFLGGQVLSDIHISILF